MVPHCRRVVELDPALAIAWGQYALGLHQSGMDDEALRTLDRAVTRWPGHGFLWQARFLILMFARRFREAADFARDLDGLPEMMAQQGAERMAKLADALATGQSGTSLVAELVCMTCNVDSAPFAMSMLAVGGAVDEAFQIAEAYFFGGTFAGQHIPPPGVADERLSFMLFSRPVLALKDDPRFASLLERTGLEDYWRKTGTQPDFRKG